MNPSPFLILSASGGVVTIISFFLPWVRAGFLDQVLPIVGPLLGLFNQELKALVEQFSTVSSITGYQAVFTLQLAGPDLPLLALLPLISGGLAIIGTVVVALWPTGTRWISIALATASVILLIVLIVNIPVINSLGYREPWMVNMALSLLGYRPAYGFWSALGGMAVVAVGAILALVLAPPEPPRRRSTYARR